MKALMLFTLLLASSLVGISLQKSIFFDSAKQCLKDETCAIRTIKEQLTNRKNETANKKDSQLCTICEDAIPVLKELIKLNDTHSFRAIATAVCVVLNLTQESICYQAVGLFEVYLSYLLFQISIFCCYCLPIL